MTTLAQNINFVYSGGGNNSNPKNSIGGVKSNFPILGDLNNLFSNISSVEANNGKIDYRCFYVENNTLRSLYDLNIFIYSQKNTGSTVQLGISQLNEIQKIEILGVPLVGNVVFKYEQSNFTASWDPANFTNFANSLKTGLNSIGVKDCIVSSFSLGTSYSFEVEFSGSQSKRRHKLLQVVENNLEKSDSSKPELLVTKKQEGSPLNSIAPLLAVDVVTPAGVVFSDTNSSNKIQIGEIYPGDSFPVWIKRNTPSGSGFEDRDYFIFRMTANPVQKLTSSSSV